MLAEIGSINGGAVVLGALLVLVQFAFVALFAFSYRPIKCGYMLLRSGASGQMQGHLRGVLALPFIHSLHTADMRMKRVSAACRDARSRDGVAFSIDLQAYVALDHGNPLSPVAAARDMGLNDAADESFLSKRFGAQVAQAARESAAELDYATISRHRSKLRDEIIRRLGFDLAPFLLHDIALLKLRRAN